MVKEGREGLVREGVALLNRVDKKNLSKKVVFEQRP